LNCPICSQWNPAKRPRCVFCGSDLGLHTDHSTGAAAGPYDGQLPAQPPPVSAFAYGEGKLNGSPADIARSLRIASWVVGAILVALFVLYEMCTGFY
jgi:hypothetical protein